VSQNLTEPIMNRNALISRALAVVCLTAAALPSAAQPLEVKQVFTWDNTQVIRQARVDRTGLDLNSPKDMATLLGRIDRAADGVCGGAPAGTSDYARKAFADCRADAVSGAVRSLKSRSLTALAAGRSAEQLARR